jgi:hypothetical protein
MCTVAWETEWMVAFEVKEPRQIMLVGGGGKQFDRSCSEVSTLCDAPKATHLLVGFPVSFLSASGLPCEAATE